ncbi:SKP1-like protein 1A [Gossypium arboreum]|uniref:SKP1-like protein 1A n=1 Tax=Gossypium arboreum TaxID=29729 RepID=UPI0022F18120|nr:SKP1-like protein 1A [Gossypium arboreum]
MSVMATETNKITLLTADEEEFVVDEAIAMEFGTVKTYYEDNPDSCDEAIPLPNVTSKYLAKVIEYYKWHVEHRARKAPKPEEDEEAKAFDEALFNTLDNEGMKQMIMAANYLDAKDLLEMLTQAVADRIKNKSVEYVRKVFGIENDYTPEEEAELRKQNEWAFEDLDPDDN